MLCEISSQYGFLAVWLSMSLLGVVSVLTLSGAVFLPFYAYPSYEKWVRKSNPKFPSPELVRKEIIQSLKGVAIGVVCPAFALYASYSGMLHGYCGDPHGVGVSGHLLQTLVIIGFSDFVEYAYHWLGHRYHTMWNVHKHHHVFYNPTPFAVIADELVDQFMRSLPMVILPAMMPINIDLLFTIYSTLFYGYGVYLHWGFESPYLSAHNPIFNTSYHHYSHHAVSVIGRPVYTGFFFKIWDNLFNTCSPSPCSCYECRPMRSKADYAKVVKPDYSVLLSPSFWATASMDIKE
mmetsp:Transcript_14353/g.21507  ORF Transcript_14353/g.21507 Transcript_14353/m.21507 type:complete len:292 (+) Transcript_14353:116-991(+)